MGIGNSDMAPRSPDGPNSHYPSWGLETVASAAESPSLFLTSLPLMGIGNAIDFDAAARQHYVSLPLMGIGNSSASTRTSSAASASLPLMGIGNPPMCTCWPAGTSTSLPLMGIGNNQARFHAGRDTLLITPHGDWKLRGRLAGTGIAPSSLPLMGIGNGMGYPHAPGSRGSHYPSWGLETVRLPARVGLVGTLITPHGDWKLGSGSWPLRRH